MESAHMAPADDDVSASSPGLSGDAALVVGLAATAMPFAHTAEDQAESWLRTLRLHGSVGAALSSLGMSEEQLLSRSVPKSESVGTPVPEGDVIERVVRSAVEFTIARGGECAGTGDLLFALFDVYGRIMDRALFMHGITRSQVFDALAAGSREQTL